MKPRQKDGCLCSIKPPWLPGQPWYWPGDCLALGRAGASVAIAARTVEELDETVEAMHAENIACMGILCDVSDWYSVKNAVRQAIFKFGSISILVNNAGIQGAIGPLVENDCDDWMRTIAVNLGGVFHCCKAVLPG
jgi:NAD(P)-dependent dehydrogenase (short-subunit alcohol dehydrogenase family)